MKIRVLGCSGGIGGHHLRTTSFLVDHDVLIDAGTGVADLSLAELAAIDHVFLTHAHLDHIACLPLLLDTVMDRRDGRPITVHAPRAVIDTLARHIFNWEVWPDFATIPAAAPMLCYALIEAGEAWSDGARHVTALPAEHTVPTVGYHLAGARGSFVFTGDTTRNPALWPLLNAIADLRVLVIECAFPNRERQLAELSKHLCPALLAEELVRYTGGAEVFVTHLKTGQIEETMAELESLAVGRVPRMLQHNQVFEL